MLLLLAYFATVTQKWRFTWGKTLKQNQPSMDTEIILSLIFGGLAGVLLRTVFFALIGNEIYLANLLFDLVGSFFIGFIFNSKAASRNYQDKICSIAAILGSMATFSAFVIDIFKFAQIGEFKRAFLYFAITNLLAITGCFLGYQMSVDAEEIDEEIS